MKNKKFEKIYKFGKSIPPWLLISIGYFIFTRLGISISKELLFWTFSTVMQSFVALGALLGMIAVFKLQVINSNIEKLESLLRSDSKDWKGTLEEFLNEHENSWETNPYLKSLPYQIGKLSDEKKKIRRKIINFIEAIITLTICALMFLVGTPSMIWSYYGSLWCLFLVFSLATFSLVVAIKLIKEIL